VAAQLEQLLPPAPPEEEEEEWTANDDNRRRTSAERHSGQATAQSPRTSSSNVVPHSLQLNS